MPKRHHTFLFILTVIVAAGALVQDYRFSTALANERGEVLARMHDLGAIELAVANLRGAQAGYVATGQAPTGSTSRATALSSEIEAALTRLRNSASEAAARTRYDEALAAFADFAAIDLRARSFVATERRYEASDLIFIDALEPLQRLNAALAEARTAERQAADQRTLASQRLQLAVVVIAMVFLLAVAMFFRRAASRATPDPVLSITGKSEPATLPAAPREPVVSAPAVSPAVPATVVPAAARQVSLTDAAELCVDLARVIDGRDVPALLERAADVLGAKGAVLWVADADRASLRPSFACGYPEKVLARLGSLPVDADNVTSLAYRSMRAQVVGAAPPGTRGAIAVPLVTAAGCVGVLAAELQHGRPGPDTLAVARMIAAQVAALVGPGDVAAARAAQA